MKIYIVTASYVTEEDADSLVKAFSTYDKARAYLESCIAAELESDWFKEHSNMVIEFMPNFWCAYQDGDYNLNHSQYEILELEVQ